VNITSLLNALPGAAAQGLIWGIMAIGVFITFKVMDVADLTVDGTMCTGGAVSIMMLLNGQPMWFALICACLAGMAAGAVTGLLHTKMGIPVLLSGILTQLSLYSVNLKIMGKANQAISSDRYNLLISSRYINDPATPWYKYPILTASIFIVVIIIVLYWFFGTELGCAIRATGANENMARAQGINTSAKKVLGLMISNGLVALSSALYCQYANFTDVNIGRGAIVIGLAAVIIGDVLFSKVFHNFALKLLSVVFGAIIYYLVMQFVSWLGLDTDYMKLLSAAVVAVFLAVPYWKGKYFTKPAKRGASLNA